VKRSTVHHGPGVLPVLETDLFEPTAFAPELQDLAFGPVGVHEVLAGATEKHAVFLEKVPVFLGALLHLARILLRGQLVLLE